MQKVLRLLDECKIIKQYTILDSKVGSRFYYIKIEVIFVDNSKLFIREFVSSNEYVYSYHWQDENGNLIIRWDNAPHHKHIKTYPHHKHTPKVAESYETSLEDVLRAIKRSIEKKE